MAAERTRAAQDSALGLRLPRCKAAIVLVALALACCTSARALDHSLDISQYAHTSWKVRDGFTKGLIVAIAQDPDGYLWLGTEFGLARFDGVRAVPWQPPTGQQLPSNNIQSLLFARDGTLWIGTLSGLASWRDGKLTTYPEMAGQIVISLLQDRESAIWAGGARLPAGGKLCSLRNARTDCYGGDGALGVGIFGLYEDTLQNLWLGTNKGFWRWKPGPPQFFPAPPDTYGVRGLGEDDEHALLISLEGGIRRFMNGHFEAHQLPYRGLTTWVRQIFRDRERSLWIATFTHGLVHVHQGKVDTFSSSDGLSGDSVYSILEDREGNVWVATNNGIDQFRAYSVPTISIKQGLGNTFVVAALAARDGSVWIARANGLDRWDQDKIFAYRTSNGDRKPGRTLAPSSLFEDSSGRIWAATNREFVYLDHGRLVSVRGYPGGFVRGIAEGPTGHLWVASDQSGLLQIFQGKVVQQLSWSGLGFEKYGDALAADPAKEGLWIGFWQGGIAYVANGKVQASYSVAEGLGQGIVNHLRIDSGGALWAATDGGLSRIQDGHVSTLTSRNGLPCDGVLWTIEDDERAVWLYMPCGLVRIAREELDAWVAGTKMTVKTRVLDASDGVGTHNWARAYGPPVTKTQDGKIWFTTSDGVSIIDPHHVAINSLPPPVHIERIMADDKPYNPATGLHLPSRVHYLTIDYTALSFTVPEKVRFRYRLEGLDPGWREVINDRKVQYSNPPPGHYRFRVIAANNSGVWNEQGDTLEFDIPPAWYQTLWFRALCAVALFLFLWWAYLLRVRHLRDQERKLRDVIETIPTFAWTTLPDGSVDFVNHHWKEFTGLSTARTVGSGWQEVVHPEDLNRHGEKWRDSITTGEPFESEVRYLRAEDGQYRWFLARAVPLRDTRGKIMKWYGTSTDIEDRKRSEQERERLRQLEADLARLNRVSMMGELAASLAHEIKQPIAATATNAKTGLRWLQREPPDTDEAREALSRILNDARRAADIIERNRSLYRGDTPKRETVNLNEVVREMIALLRDTANRQSVLIRGELDEDVPTMTADRVQMQQVLMNLMLNGIEAMKDTGGELTIRSKRTEDRQILLSVSDVGVGLPGGNADRVFDAFFTTKAQGTGMGLSICRRIIESHGGRLWACANTGRGTTFHLTLPSATSASATPAA